MFQFSGFASYTYVFSAWWPVKTGRVSPFGNLRIKVCLPTPRSLSQATTSFIACCRQGIRHMRLFTWPYNPKQSDLSFCSIAANCFLTKSRLLTHPSHANKTVYVSCIMRWTYCYSQAGISNNLNLRLYVLSNVIWFFTTRIKLHEINASWKVITTIHSALMPLLQFPNC